ncbi:serine/threonine-protein kinase fray2-like [Galendromus occidentalis]|uniref:non-specific serine/threonine protein kinase n=1 Tax=Galendromus occidentalis TaxID=34638 RepID=A0AAJ6VXE6_9ACAR|nr:serine/threonine-protein kinase fray2-like [Galendromus occidentalis]
MSVEKKPRGFLNEAVWPNRITIRQDAISDSYAVETRPFARGKFATVRRCRHMESGRDYAAKYLRKRRRSEDVRHELIHEALVLAIAEDCERIVSLREVFETPSEVILVLEMASGGELQHVLDSEDCLPEASCRQLLLQICQGLEFLHRNHIAHLDIKPANLLLTSAFPHGEAKLCDFGISRLILPGEVIHEIAGTPDYIAPEVLQYEPISLATDMWSVGILTYVLLTGHTPFGGDTKQDTYCNITLGELDFPQDLFEDVSPEAIHFITQLVVKDPKKRLGVGDVLRHPWLNSSSHSPMSMSVTCLSEGDHNNNIKNIDKDCASLIQCETPPTSSMGSCESDNEMEEIKSAAPVIKNDDLETGESVAAPIIIPPIVPNDAAPLSPSKTAEQVVEIQDSSEEERLVSSESTSDSDSSSEDEQVLITDVTDEPGSQVEAEENSATPIVTDSEDVLSPNTSHSNIHILHKNQRILLNRLADRELLKPSGSQSSTTSKSLSASDLRKPGALKRRPSKKKAKSKSQSNFCDSIERRNTVIERVVTPPGASASGPSVRPKTVQGAETREKTGPSSSRKTLNENYARIEDGEVSVEKVDDLREGGESGDSKKNFRRIEVNVVREGEPVVEEPASDSNASSYSSKTPKAGGQRLSEEDRYEVESVSSEDARRIETRRIVDEVMRENRPKSPELSVFDRINQRAAKFMDIGLPLGGSRKLNRSRFHMTDFAKTEETSVFSRSNNLFEDFELKHGDLMGRFMMDFPFRNRDELGLGKSDLRRVHLREYNAQARDDTTWQYAKENSVLKGDFRNRCPFSDHLSRFDGTPQSPQKENSTPRIRSSDSESTTTGTEDFDSDVAWQYQENISLLSSRQHGSRPAAASRAPDFNAEEDLSIDAQNMWQYQESIPILNSPTERVPITERTFEEKVRERRKNALQKLNPSLDGDDPYTDEDNDLINQIMGTDLGDGLPVYHRDLGIQLVPEVQPQRAPRGYKPISMEDCSDDEDDFQFERPKPRNVMAPGPVSPLQSRKTVEDLDMQAEAPKTLKQETSKPTRGKLSRLLSKLDEWEEKIKGARKRDDIEDEHGFHIKTVESEGVVKRELSQSNGNQDLTEETASAYSRREVLSHAGALFEEETDSYFGTFSSRSFSSRSTKSAMSFETSTVVPKKA